MDRFTYFVNDEILDKISGVSYYLAMRRIFVDFYPTGDTQADKRRLKLLVRTLRDKPGEDLFTLRVFENKIQYFVDFDAPFKDFGGAYTIADEVIATLRSQGYNIDIQDFDAIDVTDVTPNAAIEKIIDPDDF
jgi:hypothetical protein